MMSSTLCISPIQPKCREERSPFVYNFKAPSDSPNVDTFDTLATALSESKCSTLSRADISNILDTLDLDPPLVDYLVAHGAISADTGKDLLRWDCLSEGSTSKIETLLDCLEIFDHSGQKFVNDNHVVSQNPKLTLLINALRSTGQHALASRLDSGPRILPSRFTTSPGTKDGEYDPLEKVDSLGETRGFVRRRGQLRLWLQVAAIKVNPAKYEELIPPPTRSETANVGGRPRRGRWKSPDISEDSEPVKQILQTSHGTSYWINLESIHRVLQSPSRRSLAANGRKQSSKDQYPCLSKPASKALHCFSFFLCGLRKRPSDCAADQIPAASCPPKVAHDYRLPSYVLPLPSPNVDSAEATDMSGAANTEETARLERLRRAKLTLLDEKSNQLFSLLADPSSTLHDALVKFLEQATGVLVLGCCTENALSEDTTVNNQYIPASSLQPTAPAFSVTIVATQREAVKRLFSSVTIEPSSVGEDDTNCSGVEALPPVSQLSAALETVLTKAGALESCDLQALRLGVGLQTEEIRSALSELTE
nr:unnamed protein product [Spirometra erinaceieuropaei]